MRVTASVIGLCVAASAGMAVSASAQDQGQAGGRLDVKVGECSMRLKQSELDLLKPKGQGQLVWVGPCVNGFIDGFGVLLSERTDADGVTRRHAGGYNSSGGMLGRPRYPAYISGDGSFHRDESQAKDPVAIPRSQVPAWASFVAGKGQPTASERQAISAHLKSDVAAPVASPATAAQAGLVSAGACKLRFNAHAMTRFKAENQGLIVWVGPCANGMAHGNGIVLERSRDPQNKVVYRYARRHLARDGELILLQRPLYIGSSDGVWIDEENAKETARIKNGEVPAWAAYVLGKGDLTHSQMQAAREFLEKEAHAKVPPPDQIVDAGGCKLVLKTHPRTRELRWRGLCDQSGFAHGTGILEIYLHNGGRAINKTAANMGRIMGGSEVYDITPQREIMHLSDGKRSPVPTDQAPQWAREFLMGAPFAAAPALQQSAPAHAQAQSAVDAAAVGREREEAEARERIAQHRREDEEDERQTRRQAQAEQEARDRQWMDTATSIMAGAAALKRQQDEQNARRQAERARIETDNARYRQAQAEESRRWAEQNQRTQQAAVDRQRQEQERQRIEEARREEERRRPRKEKVNLPKYSGCIRVEWGKNIPQNVEQWYTLHNTCAQPLDVHWCDRPGCQRSTAMAKIPGGGGNRSWLLKKNGVSVSVVAACQTSNGGDEVYYNSAENQCWSWVTMN
jgi:hypothetical protein